MTSVLFNMRPEAKLTRRLARTAITRVFGEGETGCVWDIENGFGYIVYRKQMQKVRR